MNSKKKLEEKEINPYGSQPIEQEKEVNTYGGSQPNAYEMVSNLQNTEVDKWLEKLDMGLTPVKFDKLVNNFKQHNYEDLNGIACFSEEEVEVMCGKVECSAGQKYFIKEGIEPLFVERRRVTVEEIEEILGPNSADDIHNLVVQSSDDCNKLMSLIKILLKMKTVKMYWDEKVKADKGTTVNAYLPTGVPVDGVNPYMPTLSTPTSDKNEIVRVADEKAKETEWNVLFQEGISIEPDKDQYDIDIVGTDKQTEREKRDNALSKISIHFSSTAELYGQVVIREKTLRDDKNRTIKHGKLNFKGVAGGIKVKTRNMFFKLCEDPFQKKYNTYIYGVNEENYELGMKASGHEIRGAINILSASRRVYAIKEYEESEKKYRGSLEPKDPEYEVYKEQDLKKYLHKWDLRVAMMCVVDHFGSRVTVMPFLPLEKGAKLMYGSDDGMKTVNCNKEYAKLIKLIANDTHLSKHYIGRTSGVELWTAGDVEGHLGGDGRNYMIDTARFFPPEAMMIRHSSNKQHHFPVLHTRGSPGFYNMLRPELLQSLKYLGRPALSADTWCAWSDGNRQDQLNNTQATEYMLTTAVDKFCEDILTQNNFSSGDLHKFGINVRHMGVARQSLNTKTKESSKIVDLMNERMFNQMFDRTIKNTTRGIIRDETVKGKSDAEIITKVNFLINFLINNETSDNHSYLQIKKDLYLRFGKVFNDQEDFKFEKTFTNQNEASRRWMAGHILLMSGIKLLSNFGETTGNDVGQAIAEIGEDDEELRFKRVKQLDQDYNKIILTLADVRLSTRLRDFDTMDFSVANLLFFDAVAKRISDPLQSSRLFSISSEHFQKVVDVAPLNYNALKGRCLATGHSHEVLGGFLKFTKMIVETTNLYPKLEYLSIFHDRVIAARKEIVTDQQEGSLERDHWPSGYPEISQMMCMSTSETASRKVRKKSAYETVVYANHLNKNMTLGVLEEAKYNVWGNCGFGKHQDFLASDVNFVFKTINKDEITDYEIKNDDRLSPLGFALLTNAILDKHPRTIKVQALKQMSKAADDKKKTDKKLGSIKKDEEQMRQAQVEAEALMLKNLKIKLDWKSITLPNGAVIKREDIYIEPKKEDADADNVDMKLVKTKFPRQKEDNQEQVGEGDNTQTNSNTQIAEIEPKPKYNNEGCITLANLLKGIPKFDIDNPEDSTNIILYDIQNIHHLLLSDNNIDDLGAHELAKALHINNILEHLDLSKNNIGPKGIEAFAFMLKINHILDVLNLSEMKNRTDNSWGDLALSSSTLAHCWYNPLEYEEQKNEDDKDGKPQYELTKEEDGKTLYRWQQNLEMEEDYKDEDGNRVRKRKVILIKDIYVKKVPKKKKEGKEDGKESTADGSLPSQENKDNEKDDQDNDGPGEGKEITEDEVEEEEEDDDVKGEYKSGPQNYVGNKRWLDGEAQLHMIKKKASNVGTGLKTLSLHKQIDVWYIKTGLDEEGYLGDNTYTDDEIITLKQTLSLQRMDYEDVDLILIGSLLQTYFNCTVLNLYGNKINDKGAQALSEILQNEEANLETLNLGHNDIGDDGAIALAEGLKKNITLVKMYVNNNNIGNAGARAMNEALIEQNKLSKKNKPDKKDTPPKEKGDNGAQGNTSDPSGYLEIMSLIFGNKNFTDDTLKKLVKDNKNKHNRSIVYS